MSTLAEDLPIYFEILITIYSLMIDRYPARLFASVFHSFEAGIGHTIFSFK